MVVELFHQRKVVEHRRHIEQFGVEGDPLFLRVARRPEVGTHGVVEERG
jgi:hypothetical protein